MFWGKIICLIKMHEFGKIFDWKFFLWNDVIYDKSVLFSEMIVGNSDWKFSLRDVIYDKSVLAPIVT